MIKKIWLAASYHMPSTYSVRSPASSPYHAQALPVPSSATVKLGLIRKSCELWGQTYTRNNLFHEIMAANIYVEPPEHVGVSLQLLKAFKGSNKTLMYREFCHAGGHLVIYAKVQKEFREQFEQLFRSICYWGRTDSFSTCMDVKEVRKPDLSNVIKPIQEISIENQLYNFECGIALEMLNEDLSWEDLKDDKKMAKYLRKSVLTFGLEVIERHSNSRLLQRRSLE